MITIKSAAPEYFLSVVKLLLLKAGKKSDFGYEFRDSKGEIRGSANLDLIRVTANTVGMLRDGKTDDLIAELRDGTPMVTSAHHVFTSSLEWELATAYKGDHVYTVRYTDATGSVMTARVVAGSPDAVETALERDDKDRKVISIESIETAPSDLLDESSFDGMILSNAMLHKRDIAQKLLDAQGSDDSVYLFEYHFVDDQKAVVVKAPLIQGESLTDAEASVRAEMRKTRGEIRIVRVSIETVLAYYSSKLETRYASAPLVMSIAVKARAKG